MSRYVAYRQAPNKSHNTHLFSFELAGKTETSWNSDGFSGVSAQRAEILQLAMNYANNLVILGGDVHDSWAYSISEDGMGGGKF